MAYSKFTSVEYIPLEPREPYIAVACCGVALSDREFKRFCRTIRRMLDGPHPSFSLPEEWLMPTPDAAKRRALAKKGEANRDGSYPTDTRGRARAAKSRASAAERSGRMSKSEEKRIDARADAKLKRK